MAVMFPLLGATTSFWSLVVDSVRASSALENAILLLLVACSIISWAIVIWKVKSLRQNKAAGEAFLQEFTAAEDATALAQGTANLPVGAHLLIYRAATAAQAKHQTRAAGNGATASFAQAKQAEQLAMDMNHAQRTAFAKLHRGMDILASIASATPFIGLFGTVLGIMSTFQVLGSAKSASLNVVAPGIAAALIATAAGLAVAIPAVFSFNWIMARIDEQQEQAEMFAERLTQSMPGLHAVVHHEADAAPEHVSVGN